MRPAARVALALACLAGSLVSAVPAEAAYPGADGRIAWTSTRSGNRDVWSMNPDGSGQVNLTQNAAMDAFPAWSPDGSRIAFTSGRRGKNWDLYVMDADGSDVHPLTAENHADWLPAWSPDGSLIAFTRNRDGDDADLWVMNADGSNAHELAGLNSAADDALPVFSPDGSRIAFRTERDGNWEIYVGPADGSGPPVDVSRDPSDDRAPSWSPNGQRLAFKSDRTGSFEIYTSDPDGGGLTRLTFDKTSDEYPTWSPDGSRLAFQSARDGNNELYVMNVDGSGVIRLTNDPPATPYLDFDPDWQPVSPGPGADLAVTLADGPDPLQVGETLVYRAAVTNNGAAPAPGTMLTVAVPAQVDVADAEPSQGSCTIGADVECSLGTVARGATATVRVEATASEGGDAAASATASSSAADPVAGNEHAAVQTTVVDDSGRLAIALSGGDFAPKLVTAPSLGSVATWTIADPGSHTVSDRSGISLYDSGVLEQGSSFRLLLFAAAGWIYRCRIHPKSESGTVKVPMAIEPGPGASRLIRWAVDDPPPGVLFDVQVKRPGQAFEMWQAGTVTRSATFSPDAGAGTYAFRARMRNTRMGKTLWSPVASFVAP